MAPDLYLSANLLSPFALKVIYSYVLQSFGTNKYGPSISFLDLVLPLPIWAIHLNDYSCSWWFPRLYNLEMVLWLYCIQKWNFGVQLHLVRNIDFWVKLTHEKRLGQGMSQLCQKKENKLKSSHCRCSGHTCSLPFLAMVWKLSGRRTQLERQTGR